MNEIILYYSKVTHRQVVFKYVDCISRFVFGNYLNLYFIGTLICTVDPFICRRDLPIHIDSIDPNSFLLRLRCQKKYNPCFFYIFSYESTEHMNIQVSTKVCSFGKQVVEKLETEYPQVQHNGRYLYKIARSPMCEYMVNFIHKLKHLPEKYMMNSVLENFTILQVNV